MLDEEIANKINEKISKGYSILYDDEKSASAIWEDLWKYVLSTMDSNGYNCINSFDEDYIEFNNIEENEFSEENLYNWAGDYKNLLAYLGENDKIYYQKRIDFLSKYLEIFTIGESPPEGCSEFEYKNDYYNFLEQKEFDNEHIVNFRGAIAESYVKIGNKERGQELFNQAIEEYPKYKKRLKKWADKYQ
jgi:tetratricopeptide (TPR) repeat protein